MTFCVYHLLKWEFCFFKNMLRSETANVITLIFQLHFIEVVCSYLNSPKSDYDRTAGLFILFFFFAFCFDKWKKNEQIFPGRTDLNQVDCFAPGCNWNKSYNWFWSIVIEYIPCGYTNHDYLVFLIKFWFLFLDTSIINYAWLGWEKNIIKFSPSNVEKIIATRAARVSNSNYLRQILASSLQI